MGRKLSFIPEDEPDELVRRYEDFLAHHATSGYFDVEEFEQIVDYYLRRGRTKDSSEALEFGFRLHPNNPLLMTKRAKIYLAVGDVYKALRILDSHNISDDYEVGLLKIDALTQINRLQEAHMLAHTIIDNSSSDQDMACLDIAYIFLEQYDMGSALQYLEKGEKFNPRNQELLYELAFCQEQLQQSDNAVSTYQKILKTDPFSAEAWFNLGQIYFSRGDFQNALTAYGYAQAIRPDDSLTCLQKGHSHFQLNQYKEALEDYFAYEQMAAENWQTYLFIGESYERMEIYDKAIAFYTKSLKEHAENYEALTGIGVCLLELERYSDSLEFIRKALEIREDAADAWVYLAEGLIGIDDTKNALSAYLEAIQLDPNQPDTLMAIAGIYMDDLKFAIALKYYEKALQSDLHQELENIHLFMAVAYFKTGQPEASAISLEMAVRENMDSLKLFYELCPEANA